MDDLQLKAHFAEQKLSEATSAISNAAVDAAASAGLPRAEHLQQQRSQRRATKAQRKARLAPPLAAAADNIIMFTTSWRHKPGAQDPI